MFGGPTKIDNPSGVAEVGSPKDRYSVGRLHLSEPFTFIPGHCGNLPRFPHLLLGSKPHVVRERVDI